MDMDRNAYRLTHGMADGWINRIINIWMGRWKDRLTLG
jgi:hypothetical protein